MLDPKLDDIQPGWTVVASDGREIGTVLGTQGGVLRVKTAGLRSSEVSVPADAVEEVETGRVELGLTKGEIEKNG